MISASWSGHASHQKLRWFRPEEQMESLLDWTSQEACRAKKKFHLLDLYGASRKMAKAWEQDGWRAVSFDIKFGPSFDITSERGFRHLCQIAVQLPAAMRKSNVDTEIHKHS